jgi:hypothetical protein
MIRHIVTWKLKNQDAAAKSAAFDLMADGFGALPALIPEIRTLHIGRDLGETAGNWDVVLTIDYASTAALDAYQAHPEHERVKTMVGPLLSERASIDFEL